MGYGKRAIKQLMEYYSGNIVSLNEEEEEGAVSNGNKVPICSILVSISRPLF